MATLSATIKAILDGTKTPVPTTAEMKSALGTLYDFLTDLLGTDSTNKGAARDLLQVPSRAGYRNVIINGDFRINQRAAVSGATVSAANTYTLDRWRVITSGQSMSWTASGTGFQATAPAGGIEQVVNGADIVQATYGIDWTGTATCTVNGTAVTKGQAVTLTPGSNASVKFFNGTLSQVRLEPDRAQPWETRPLWVEQMLCLYYYERIEYPIVLHAGASGQNLTVPFKARKRTTPTITLPYTSGISATIASSYTDAGQVTVTSTALGNVAFRYTADAEL